MQRNSDWPVVESSKYENSDGVSVDLDQSQRDAINEATRLRLGILTGGPGTGKTFTLAKLLSLVDPSKVACAAPTGKAALRMKESLAEAEEYCGVKAGRLKQIPCSTIHSLLGVSRNGHDGGGWGFLHGPDRPLRYKYLVVDETSMIGCGLYSSLLSACKTGANILLVGDPHQLPPVEHGFPLRDLIQSERFPIGRLTKPQRYAGRLAECCQQINRGQLWTPSEKLDLQAVDESGAAYPENVRHMPALSPVGQLAVLTKTIEALRDAFKFVPVTSIQVLSPLNSHGQLARKNVNEAIRSVMSPKSAAEAKRTGLRFGVGDRVICLQNGNRSWSKAEVRLASKAGTDVNPKKPPQEMVANGEQGFVASCSEKSVEVVLDGREAIHSGRTKREVTFIGKDMKNLDLAYCLTVHKAQGSQFPAVIVLIDDGGGAKRVATRSWYYTAMSRASKVAVTIGRMASVGNCISVDDSNKRVTDLKRMLQEAIPEEKEDDGDGSGDLCDSDGAVDSELLVEL